MRYDYIDLFIPKVKSYGFVFMVESGPVLFIVNGKEILDGIPLYSELDENGFESEFEVNFEFEDEEDEDFEDEDFEDEDDIYTLLDEDETILVGVEVLDDDFNEISVKDITDDNYDEFIYNLLPLKMHTIDFDKITLKDTFSNNKFKKILLNVVKDYKRVLKLSKT